MKDMPIRTEIITITKIENGHVFDGQANWPEHRFEKPCVGDSFKIVMQGANILDIKPAN